MVRAEHSSELVWKNPATERDETHPGGEPVGFVLELESGLRIYHMGDTALFGDMRLVAERLRPASSCPSAAHGPAGRGLRRARVAEAEDRDPDPLGTTPLLKGTPEEFVKALGDAPVKVLVLQPGEKAAL